METPFTRLASLAIRHLGEETSPIQRAEILDAAASMFSLAGDSARAEQLATTAAVIREAENAQMQLHQIFASQP